MLPHPHWVVGHCLTGWLRMRVIVRIVIAINNQKISDMKTIEEKARAYDSIIEKANKMHSENCEACKACIEELIPELAESEGEKVRNGLVRLLKELLELGGVAEDEWDRNECEKYIAWLEKQGEKKPEENKGNIGEISPNWSEEDEKEMAAIEHHLNNCGASITSILWLKSLKDRVGCEANCTTTKEWSEEDEHRIKDTVYFLDTAKKHYASTEELDACIDWLKSFKGRVQPKQEWNEEDSIRLQRIIDFLWYNRKGDTDTICQQEQDIDWLKSLRPQNHWKPSDEQMMALLYHCSNGSVLSSLYNDLNKLKEE